MALMKDRMKEVAELTRRLKEEYPRETEGFLSFLKDAESGEHLSAKHKELINVAMSVAAQCEWCIAFHVKNAARLGATKGEKADTSAKALFDFQPQGRIP